MGRTKTLGELGLTLPGGQGIAITGLAVDSREVRDGFLFAALPGSNAHGGDFIQYAVRQGAAAILTDRHGVDRAGGWPMPPRCGSGRSLKRWWP